MLLTIGLMVKNEEKHLARCIEALMPILNKLEAELVIVDTGSEDNTVEIARKYTEKVYFYEWNNDFGEMRNRIISHSIGEWYFSIDADEIIKNPDEIVSFFESNQYKLYNSATILIKSFKHSLDDKEFVTVDLKRLFRKDKDFKFIGSIHEQPVSKLPTKKLNCTVEHYGYLSDDNDLMDRKYSRNKELLEIELKKNPENIYIKYQLAVTYSMNRMFKESLEILENLYSNIGYEEKKKYKYVVNDYALALQRNNNNEECERVCLEGIDLIEGSQIYKIDLMFYLAKSQILMKKYKECINSYNRYFELLKEYKENKLPLDSSATVYTMECSQSAIYDIIVASYEMKKYDDVIEKSLLINDEKIFRNIISCVVNSLLETTDYKKIYRYYKEKVSNFSTFIVTNFIKILELNKLNLDNDIVLEIERNFSSKNDLYERLNEFRLSLGNRELFDNILSEIINLNKNEQEFYYGELLYFSINENYKLNDLLSVFTFNILDKFIEFCDSKYKNEFRKKILNYLENNLEETFVSIKSIILFSKYLLDKDEYLDNDVYKMVFDKYIEYGVKYISLVYSKTVIEEELVEYIKDEEDQFFICMYKAIICKNEKVNYIKNLKKALKMYPRMKKGIEGLIGEFQESLDNKQDEQMESLKKELINNINLLISCGKINEVKVIINQYEQIMGIDEDILNIKKYI